MESLARTEQLTLFPPDIHASLSVMPGSEEARRMTAISGRKLLDYYKRSDPIGLLVRMLLDTLHWGSTMCYLTWKDSTTPRKRLLFRLVPSMPDTDEIEYSLWPTPDTNNHRDGTKLRKDTNIHSGGKHGVSLHHAVVMWPTPRANDAKKRGNINPEDPRNGLPAAVKMWPTPVADDTSHRKNNYAQGGTALSTAAEGQLNPDWVESLMNFPIGWTEVE
jgi:hypothetical protein